MHPLQIDMSTLTDSVIEERIRELTKKYSTIMRVSPSASGQLLMLLEDYRFEQQSRQMKQQEAMSQQLGDDYDGLINVG